MRARQLIVGGLLALLGLVLAAGIGLAANALSGERIGLAARPVAAGESLAPPAATARAPGASAARRTTTSGTVSTARPTGTARATTSRTTTTRRATGTTTGVAGTDDDHGGDRGRGRSRSGSGGRGGADD